MLKRELRRLAYMLCAFAVLEAPIFALHSDWRLKDHLDEVVVVFIGGLIGGYATDFLILPWWKRRGTKLQP